MIYTLLLLPLLGTKSTVREEQNIYIYIRNRNVKILISLENIHSCSILVVVSFFDVVATRSNKNKTMRTTVLARVLFYSFFFSIRSWCCFVSLFVVVVVYLYRYYHDVSNLINLPRSIPRTIRFSFLICSSYMFLTCLFLVSTTTAVK